MPYTTNKGVRIYWEEDGEGDPLLMLMGLSFSMAMWGELRAIMARHFRVILIDNRCVGKSDSPNFPFTVEAMAHDAACVIHDAGVEKAHVIGLSMGGMIAQQLAISRPDCVAKLILGCTSCSGPQAVWAESKFLELLRFPLISKEARIRALLPNLYHRGTPRDRIDRDLDIIRANAPPIIASMKQIGAMTFWTCCHELDRIKSPTLVMHGDSDAIIPPASAEAIAGRIAGARLVLIPNAGHIFPTDQPEITCKELLGFLIGPLVMN